MGLAENSTLLIGIPDEVLDTWTVRDISVATYTLACFILGFFGNLFVVVTSHVYQSIDLDSVTIVFVRQLAIADLMQVINTILPTLITVFYKKWVLGDLLCDITGHFNFIPVMVNIYLVLNMSAFKVLACKMPFRMRDVTSRHAWWLVLLAYLLSGIELLESVFLGGGSVYMAPVDRCLSKIYMTHPTLMLWNAAIPVGVPILAIIVCNVWIFVIVRRVVTTKGQGSQSRALMTIGAVSGLFVLSWTPKLVYVTVVNITKRQVPWAVAFSHFFPFINSVGNPLIYTFTNKRYGEFVYNATVKVKVSAMEGASSVRKRVTVRFLSSRAMQSTNDSTRYETAPEEPTNNVDIELAMDTAATPLPTTTLGAATPLPTTTLGVTNGASVKTG